MSLARLPVLFALLGACTALDGQKVTVLLRDRVVTCETNDAGDRVGYFELDQPDDLYVAELVSIEDADEAFTLRSRRVGRLVTFECIEGLDDFIVRHGTVLQARDEAVAPEDDRDAPSGGF